MLSDTVFPNIIHLLDRTETNIILIWSDKVILGEVLSNKCFIIAAHVVRTQSIARFIDWDQYAIYHAVRPGTSLHIASFTLNMGNFIAFN